LRKLAQLVARVAELESHGNPTQGLLLLGGIERSEPELARLGFLDAVITKVRLRKLFPSVSGDQRSASQIRRPPHGVWWEVGAAQHFPELLDKSAAVVGGLLDKIGLTWLPPVDVARRLEAWVASLAPKEAGELVGKLLDAGQIPRHPLAALLFSAEGRLLKPDRNAFLPAEKRFTALPTWVEECGFLHADFVEALRQELGVSTSRDVRLQLTMAGYKVREYQAQDISDQLLREAERRSREMPEASQDTWRDVLRWAFEMTLGEEDVPKLSAKFSVITTAGSIVPATRCYLGPAYPSGELLCELYAPLGEDEFVAAPGELLGLTDADPTKVERFLVSIGVGIQPRPRPLDWSSFPTFFNDYVTAALSMLHYPNRLFDEEAADVQGARALLLIDGFPNIQFPDRLCSVIERGSPEAVIKFLASNGGAYMERDVNTDALLTVQSSYRVDPLADAVYDPNAIVVCIGGQRGYYDPFHVFHPLILVGGFEGYYDSHHRFVSSAPGIRIRVQQQVKVVPPVHVGAPKPAPRPTSVAAGRSAPAAPARPIQSARPPEVIRSAPVARPSSGGGGRRK
jgi:hypothetical protein